MLENEKQEPLTTSVKNEVLKKDNNFLTANKTNYKELFQNRFRYFL